MSGGQPAVGAVVEIGLANLGATAER